MAALLALSDERDLWLRRVYAAWREGYQAALDDAVVASLLRIFPAPGHVSEIEKRRYPPDGRERFADPRPGELAGPALIERARRSWLDAGLPLGPRPGEAPDQARREAAS